MADSTNVETSLTLLRALQDAPRQEEAWAKFLARYQPLLEQWCRRWGLSGVDAEDAIADLLVKLLDKGLLRHFDQTRPFRAWLQAIVHNAVRAVDFRAISASLLGRAPGLRILDPGFQNTAVTESHITFV